MSSELKLLVSPSIAVSVPSIFEVLKKQKGYINNKHTSKSVNVNNTIVHQTNFCVFAASGELTTSDNSLFLVDETRLDESTKEKIQNNHINNII